MPNTLTVCQKYFGQRSFVILREEAEVLIKFSYIYHCLSQNQLSKQYKITFLSNQLICFSNSHLIILQSKKSQLNIFGNNMHKSEGQKQKVIYNGQKNKNSRQRKQLFDKDIDRQRNSSNQNLSQGSQKSQIFDQIDNVLLGNNNKVSRKELLLKLKVDQLQRFSEDLAADNRRLTDKIQQLLNERQSKISQSGFVDELSQMGSDFGQIETLLKQYRSDLSDFQKKLKDQMAIKDKKIEELNVELAIANQEDFKLKDRCFLLEKKNKEYQYKIDTLQKQIKIIQVRGHLTQSSSKSQLSRTRSRKEFHQQLPYKYQPSYQRGNRVNVLHKNFNMMGMSNNFNPNVQQELQILIEKLVHQLQHERSLKRKMNQQIRRLNHQLYESQQQIKNRNNKIYSLELKLIKQQKKNLGGESRFTSNQDHSQIIVPNLEQNQKKNRRAITSNNQAVKNFTLNQMFNKEVNLANHQKMLVFQKVYEYFLSKIESNSFTQVKVQQILIFNYHSQNLNMISVRESSSVRDSLNKQTSVQTFIWNMALILMKILNQVPDQLKKSGIYETIKQNLNLLLEDVLENRYEGSLNQFIEEIGICLQQYFAQKTELKTKNYDLRRY